METAMEFEYDFDFDARKKELHSIAETWWDQVKKKEVVEHIQFMAQSLVDEINLLIDEGHPPNRETIKRNFDYAKSAGFVVADIGYKAYCIGYEYGTKGLQPAPVREEDEIPKSAKELFIVTLEPLNALGLRLMADIYEAYGLDEIGVRVRKERLNMEAVGYLLVCYRLGVAYGMEAIH